MAAADPPGDRRARARDPGGGILPLSNMQMELLALAILVPALVLAVLFTRGRFARG